MSEAVFSTKSEPDWKKHVVALTAAVLGVSFLIFLVTGYIALYWVWVRGNLEAALPYVPWARNFGMLAMAGAAVALVILFSSTAFPISPKIRLSLSLLATATIGFSVGTGMRVAGKCLRGRIDGSEE